MKDFIKNNFALLLAFILPIALIVIVALSTYLPSRLISTDYNFIYTACTDGRSVYYQCDNYLQQRYSVSDTKLVVNTINSIQDTDKDGTPDVDENYVTRIFLHDTETNESREISLEEAKLLTLNSLITSPDGITVSSSYSRGADFFLIFDGGSSYGIYLTKGKSKSKLQLINNDDRYYYRDNFYFLGWVVPGRN